MSRFRQILAALMYLPNIMPLKALFSAEIFPWAFLYALRKDLKLTMVYVFFLVYLVVSVGMHWGSFTSVLVPARAFFALVNASLIFFLLIKIDSEEYRMLVRIFEWVFGINVFLCLIQFLGLFPSFLEPIFRLFIDRFTHEIYGGGRGVAGLFAEPSYASMSMHYYFAFFMLSRKINPRSQLGIAAIVGMIVFDLFIIRSVTGLVMILIYFASLQKARDLLKAGLVIVLLLGGIISQFGNSPNAPRSVETAHDFIKYKNYQDPMPWILEQSGFRFVSVWAAYKYGFTHPFGSGIGKWGPASIQAMDDIGIKASAMSFFASAMGSEYQGVRPTSFAAGLMLETGIVGLVLFILAFWPFIKEKALWQQEHTRSVIIFFLFNVFALGSIGDPLPFVFLALAYRSLTIESSDESIG
ncbi:MAG: hypothetical protein ORO02_04805 [Bacteroidia bacterium]|jgi:hypothetical protein|nr:hypothetical protein [Bacteroidia bacterium]